MFVIDAGTFEVSLLASTKGDSIPLGAVLSKEEGVYTRWLFVPALQGVVYFPRAAANAWFLRLF